MNTIYMLKNTLAHILILGCNSFGYKKEVDTESLKDDSSFFF